MLPSLSLFFSALGAWLIGSIPFSLLVARYGGGIDLRRHGSGNVGATNVARLLGPRWGTLALLLDAAKGAAPTLLLPWIFPSNTTSLANEQVLCGVAAVLGHMFPPWLNFRGGKGVATALGVVTVIAPAATGCAFLIFVLTFATSRIVSLSSILAAIGFAVAEFLIQGRAIWTPHAWGLGVFAIAVPLLILLRHRANMVRLWQGQEPRLQFRGKKPPSGD
jgi:glycerol-3-phosphate acyltransferase PlsY